MKAFNEKLIKEINEMKKGDTIMHGDVMLYCEDLPKDFETMIKLKDNTLALGKAHGHSHTLFGKFVDLRDNTKKVKYLKLVEPAT